MTSSRRFLSLLAASVAALAGMWWFSLGTFSEMTLAPGAGSSGPSRGVVCVLYSATITMEFYPGGLWSRRFHADSYPAEGLRPSVLQAYSPPSNFAIGWKGSPWTTYARPGVAKRHFQLQFPLWMPWFLILGLGHVVMGCVARRRTAHEEERSLAAEHAGTASMP